MRVDKMEHGKGLAHLGLSQMRAMVETAALERLEQRLEELAPQTEAKPMVSANNSTVCATD